jgi:hypothetical protein
MPRIAFSFIITPCWHASFTDADCFQAAIIGRCIVSGTGMV